MNTEKLSPDQIRSHLASFSGTENYHRHWTGALVCTDGAKAMADLCGAWWLVDAIASWQSHCRGDAMLMEMQFWTLRKQEGGKWTLQVERDAGNVAFSQEIEYSDFPLNEMKLWAGAGGPQGAMVLMLPSEY